MSATTASSPLARLQKSLMPSKSPADKTKDVSKNILAAKTLVKAISKACVEEKVAISEYGSQSVGLIDALVEEYRLKYPSLTKSMVVEGIDRYKKAQPAAGEDKEEDVGGYDDGDYELKLGRIMGAVDDEMEDYHEKIRALKKRRESAESEAVTDYPPMKRRKRSEGTARKSTSPRGPGRPRKNTPETALIQEIVARYTKEREKFDRLPNGVFEAIIDQTKKDMGMEDFDMPLENYRKRVTWYYMHRDKSNEEDIKKQKKEKNEFYENVYQRYARAKLANKGKLAPGTLESIVQGCRLEYGMDKEIKMKSLETKVQNRFKKEHPTFEPPPGVREIGKLSENDKRRRQILVNEITARYVRQKEKGPKKLADGALDKIIAETKDELGIHEFDVPKASIRGRINRKSLKVMTLGTKAGYDVIDEPLVATINNWLSQGISVTRAQGLEFANTLLKGKMGKDDDGADVVLDAKWWRAFLERNKKKIVCQKEEEK